MKAANRNESGGRGGVALPPTYLSAKRSAARPSTPKGVGRVAPLTAGRRCAELLVRSGQWITAKDSGCGQGYGRGCESSVRTNSALHCGWWRPPAADHPQSPLTLNMSGDWWWSAAGGLVFGGGPSWCGRGVAAGPNGIGERCGDRGEPKPGRNEDAFRLVGGWWS